MTTARSIIEAFSAYDSQEALSAIGKKFGIEAVRDDYPSGPYAMAVVEFRTTDKSIRAKIKDELDKVRSKYALQGKIGFEPDMVYFKYKVPQG